MSEISTNSCRCGFDFGQNTWLWIIIAIIVICCLCGNGFGSNRGGCC